MENQKYPEKEIDSSLVILKIFYKTINLKGEIMNWLKNQAKKLFGKTKPEEKTPEEKNQPEKEFEEILNTLLKLNILIRKDPQLEDEVMKEIEETIDNLQIVIPSMMERYPGETLTYELKKIGQNHLYKIVKEYLDLSSTSRKQQAEMFKNKIASLYNVAKRSKDIIENNEVAEFKTMANFLSTKF